MDFHSRKAIYEQIGDYICSRITAGEWAESARIPSVRELAVTLQVNPNTVMRTCLELEKAGILENRRGVGLFVSAEGRRRALAFLREEFIRNDLPVIAHAMKTMELSTSELVARLETLIKRS